VHKIACATIVTGCAKIHTYERNRYSIDMSLRPAAIERLRHRKPLRPTCLTPGLHFTRLERCPPTLLSSSSRSSFFVAAALAPLRCMVRNDAETEFARSLVPALKEFSVCANLLGPLALRLSLQGARELVAPFR
jgi:hypothetical protein